MKGIVFTEFIEMLEGEFGLEKTEDIIESSNLESGGVFTAVGTYEDGEMIKLLTTASEKTERPAPVLLKSFGHSLLKSFATRYSHWIADCNHGFDLLTKVDNYIHIEVMKLYPKANLPKFSHTIPDENTLILEYQSPRKMGDLAEGLIEGVMEAFNHKYSIDKKYIVEDGSIIEFTIKVL